MSSELKHHFCTVQPASEGQPQVRLHYVEQGDQDRPLVLLLHGFPEFWYAWRDYIPGLAAAGFHVVAPDLRGYNQSDKPAGVRQYAMDYLVQDIIRLLENFPDRPAIVIGHDWGGVIAWELAAHHPERLRALVVLNAPHRGALAKNLRRNLLFAVRQNVKFLYAYFFQLPWLPEQVLRLRHFSVLERALRGTAVDPNVFSDEAVAQYKAALSMPGALRATINYYRAAARSSYARAFFATALGRQRFPVIRVPTLLIWGRKDVALDHAMLNGMEQFFSGPFEKLELPDASHWVHLERPEIVLPRILTFLQQHVALEEQPYES